MNTTTFAYCIMHALCAIVCCAFYYGTSNWYAEWFYDRRRNYVYLCFRDILAYVLLILFAPIVVLVTVITMSRNKANPEDEL